MHKALMINNFISLSLFLRLIAEKITKNERKSMAEIINVSETNETEEFWSFLDEKPEDFTYQVITARKCFVPNVCRNTCKGCWANQDLDMQDLLLKF